MAIMTAELVRTGNRQSSTSTALTTDSHGKLSSLYPPRMSPSQPYYYALHQELVFWSTTRRLKYHLFAHSCLGFRTS